MFEKNLNDLVRGLRNNKSNESKYITECLDEIKQELKQENMGIKANAILKLSYIQMIGYDISWAAFNVIEVMSSPKFIHKRVAYLAASQSFHADLDVLMLATNLIKKDMSSQNQYDAGVAMVGLSCFISPDLARDLANDIMSMMVSSRPYIRKRAILLMYKVFLNFPEALRPAFPRLKEKLEDVDPGVQCAAVNVICELARKNPRNYLALAPLFFKLMTTSSNNWMLIKIIKLFGALCPLEPRLGKKLMEPLTSLVHSTSAMSLLYECINTVVAGLPDHLASMQLCVSKLRLLIEDPDQNLKYLGLLLLNKILGSQPKLVLGHRDLILQCLDDRDESIRYRALDLIAGMISKKTLVEIVKNLMQHMEKAEGSAYRDDLLSKIILICSQSNYQYVTNFEWYIDTLVQLSSADGTQHGKMLAKQMLDVTIRVKAIRKYAVPTFSGLLSNPLLLTSISEKNTTCEVLFAAAWVAGEFPEYLTDVQGIIKALLQPKVSSLPGHIQCVYVQSLAKLFSKVLTECEASDNDEELEKASTFLVDGLSIFTQSSDLEVQDRSCCVLQLIKLVVKMKNEGVRCANDVSALFAEELLPVAPKAQKKVPVPEGLDLDKWINEPPAESDESDDEDGKPFFTDDNKSNSLTTNLSSTKEKSYEPDEEELEKARQARLQYQESNPHYLKGEIKKKEDNKLLVDNIPVRQLDIPVSLQVEGKKGKGKKKGKKGKKGRKGSESEEEPSYPSYEIAPVIDLGEGDHDTRDEIDTSDPHALLDVDLDAPLGDHEVLPVQTHRIVESKSPDVEGGKPEKKIKKGKKSKTGKKDRSASKNSVDAPDGAVSNDTKSTKKTKKSKKKDGKKKDSAAEEEERKATLLAQASKYAKEKQEDSMDFWLTPENKNLNSPSPVDDTTPEVVQPIREEPAPTLGEPDLQAKTKTKKTKKTKEGKEGKKEKKGDKGGASTKEKKKKKKKKSECEGDQEPAQSLTQPPVQEASLFMDIDDAATHDPYAHYATLCEDANIKLLYEIRASPLHKEQVICSIIFRNLTSHHIQKLEFNVIDSLSMKLERVPGASSHDPVQVPFILLPEMTNEGQFAFNVESCVMSQHLRGTLTYIVKQSDGSTSEKIDFKIQFPVGVYICPYPLTSDEFTSKLSSGELTEKQSLKVSIADEKSLGEILQLVSTKLRLAVIEQIDHSASMYGATIKDHSICLLLKKINEGTLSVDAKSTDFQLLSSVLKEVKDLVS